MNLEGARYIKMKILALDKWTFINHVIKNRSEPRNARNTRSWFWCYHFVESFQLSLIVEITHSISTTIVLAPRLNILIFLPILG